MCPQPSEREIQAPWMTFMPPTLAPKEIFVKIVPLQMVQ